MRLAFLVHRRNYYKLYGPIIEAAIERGLDVELWLLQSERGSKAYLMPTVDNVPTFRSKPKVKTFATKAELNLAISREIEATFVSLHTKSRYTTEEEPFFVTLQHGIDTFVESSLAELNSSDELCLYSEFWADWATRFYSEQNAKNGQKTSDSLNHMQFTGFPQMDAVKQIDPDTVREKLGIDAGRPVVLLLPITLGNKAGAWPRFFEVKSRGKQFVQLVRGAAAEGIGFGYDYLPWAAQGWNDARLTTAIREFCDQNNAVLIVKGREKDPVRPWLSEAADVVMEDENDYPPTTLELLSVADVCIHFYSFAALEAAYMGVYGITIDRPSPAGAYNQPELAYHRLWRTHEEGSAFNFAGVNKWMSLPEAFNSLADLRFSDLHIDPEKQAVYLTKFLGGSKPKPSEQVLNLVHQEVKAK